MPDRSEWEVPAEIVAKDRATYYAKHDKDTTYEGEFEYTMSSNFELLDWAANNMDWSDVSAHAVEVSAHEAVDFQEGWVNGYKEVIDE